MKRNLIKKLKLNMEKILVLTPDHMNAAAGGISGADRCGKTAGLSCVGTCNTLYNSQCDACTFTAAA